MIWLRRLIIEMWAMLVLAGIVGFLGPFGSYLTGDFVERLWRWSLMLLGAYALVRPIILLCGWIERMTHLPGRFVVLLGTIGFSVPLAFVWAAAAPTETKALGDASGLVPFTLLCSISVYIVVWWAERADAQIRLRLSVDAGPPPATDGSTPPSYSAADNSLQPRLTTRLGSGFEGEILALESEDHYVRVHGRTRSVLLLIRLREAILEMSGVPGEQTHRSWWVARDAIADVLMKGRTCELRLVNGLRVPVARDSIQRLQRSQFLPSPPKAAD